MKLQTSKSSLLQLPESPEYTSFASSLQSWVHAMCSAQQSSIAAELIALCHDMSAWALGQSLLALTCTGLLVLLRLPLLSVLVCCMSDGCLQVCHLLAHIGVSSTQPLQSLHIYRTDAKRMGPIE
jgi:hypothetical protein